MAEKSPKELIDTLIFDVNIRSNVNSFSSRKHLFDFGIDSDLSLNEYKEIPILKEKFHHNVRGLNVDLEDGFREAKENKKLITNFDNNRRQTWIHFLRCLQKHNTIVEEEPTFVTLTSLLCDFFTVEEWDSSFFAIKFKGVIYLFRNQSLEMGAEMAQRLQPFSFFIIRFLYLITSKDNSDINGFEMSLKVDRIELNGKTLVVCYGVGANDRYGSPVYIKCRQLYNRIPESEFKQKLLFDWSHCMISGIQTLIRGRRRMSSLQDVDVMKVETIPDMCRTYWSPLKCFSFVDQSLDFIKSSVDSELQLYEFKLNSKDKTLRCFRHSSTDTPNHFFPEFYTK